MSAAWRTRLGMLVGLVATVLVLVGLGSPSAPAVGHTADPEPVTTAPDDPAAALVATEDHRLLGVLRSVPFGAGPYVERTHGAPTLVLPPGPVPYDLTSLVVLGAATRSGPVVDLGTSVLLLPGAQLRVQAPDTELRMASGPGGFTSIVGWDADLTLAGAPGHPLRIASHDPSSGPDHRPDDGRAYVRAAGGGLHVADAELTALGFRSGRTGGLALTGHNDVPATGSVTGTTVRESEYGLFVTHARDVSVADSMFIGNRGDGVRLHRDTRGVTVRRSLLADNGGSGLIADRGSADVTVEDVDTSANLRWGVAVEASPLAEHVDASGRPLGGTAGFRLRSVRTTADRHGGIELDGVTNAQVSDCAATAVPVGVFAHGGTHDVDIAGCTVVGAGRAGLAVRDGGSDIRLHHNRIGDTGTGIQVRDTPVELTANDLTGATRHGVSLVGAVGGSVVRDTVIAGSGPSAVDVRRATGPVSLIGNRVESWDDDLPWWQWLGRFLADHVMVGVWCLAVLVPLLAGHAARRRARRQAPALEALPDRARALPVRSDATGTRITLTPRW